MEETTKNLTRTYRFDPATVRVLKDQAPKVRCTESEFIRRLIRATENPIVLALVFTGHDCPQEKVA